MKKRVAGFAALAVVLSAGVFVATSNGGTSKTTFTKSDCMASCQKGLTVCTQNQRCADGRHCNNQQCYAELGDCQTQLCGHLPAE